MIRSIVSDAVWCGVTNRESDTAEGETGRYCQACGDSITDADHGQVAEVVKQRAESTCPDEHVPALADHRQAAPSRFSVAMLAALSMPRRAGAYRTDLHVYAGTARPDIVAARRRRNKAAAASRRINRKRSPR
jgi:hypothetical protein